VFPPPPPPLGELTIKVMPGEVDEKPLPSHATAVNVYEPGATLVSEMVAVSEYDVAYKTESTYNSMRAIPLRSEAVAEKGTVAPAG
jgi:hypothetical protein